MVSRVNRNAIGVDSTYRLRGPENDRHDKRAHTYGVGNHLPSRGFKVSQVSKTRQKAIAS